MRRHFLLNACAVSLLCAGLFAAAAQPPSVTPQVPQEVRNYVAFVESIESSKIATMREQVAGDLQRQQNAPGEQARARKEVNYKRELQRDYMADVQRQASEWRQVLTRFQQNPAPPSCKDLFTNYLIHLNTVEQTMREIKQTLAKT